MADLDMGMRSCLHPDCGKLFRPISIMSKFCSIKCKNRWHGSKNRDVRILKIYMEGDDRICEREGCNNSLAGYNLMARYCSHSCNAAQYKENKRKEKETLSAIICANPMCLNMVYPKVPWQKYCSDLCSNRYLRARSPELREEQKEMRRKQAYNRLQEKGVVLNKSCVMCKKLLLSESYHGRLYCSKTCLKRASYLKRKATPAVRYCTECGVDISYMRHTQKVCGDTCRAIRREKLRLSIRSGLKGVSRFTPIINSSEIPPKPNKCGNPYCNRTSVVFDHDHKTNKFRGWICGGCNNTLGVASDNPDYLRWLAEYLEQRSG